MDNTQKFSTSFTFSHISMCMKTEKCSNYGIYVQMNNEPWDCSVHFGEPHLNKSADIVLEHVHNLSGSWNRWWCTGPYIENGLAGSLCYST